MSAIISGFNVGGITEYDYTNTYSEYDIVDFQLTNGASYYPNYIGFGQAEPTFWYNNDKLEDFYLDSDGFITGWVNKTVGSGNLVNTFVPTTTKSEIDFSKNYVSFFKNQMLSGSGFEATGRTTFLAYNVREVELNRAQTIIKFGTGNVGTGTFRISGANNQHPGGSGPSGSFFWVDNEPFQAISTAYGATNIVTLVQGASAIKVRQNGVEIGTLASYNNFWKSGEIQVGGNDKTEGIDIYEMVHFTGEMVNSDVEHYEKYLFERYVPTKGIYFASQNVPAGVAYSPITYTGQSYWTQDIDDLFFLTYECSANFSSKLSILEFGDGYKTNTVNAVNPLNSTFNLKYDGLTDKQAKSLVAFFENAKNRENVSIYEGFAPIQMSLFEPYSTDAEVYLTEIQHNTNYTNINSVSITAEAFNGSLLNYKGINIPLDGRKIRTYTPTTSSFSYNDVFYYESDNFADRGYYFYTGAEIKSSDLIVLDLDNSPTGANSYFTRDFYFKSDIDYSVGSTTRLITNDFKNSTREFETDGINSNNPTLEFSFSKRTLQEARAILKYLDDKAGYKVFNFTTPQPYNKTIKVYCPEWSHSYSFYNNHTINVKFIEFKNHYNLSSVFNTTISFVPE